MDDGEVATTPPPSHSPPTPDNIVEMARAELNIEVSSGVNGEGGSIYDAMRDWRSRESRAASSWKTWNEGTEEEAEEEEEEGETLELCLGRTWRAGFKGGGSGVDAVDAECADIV